MFLHQEVATIFDPPHLLKCTCNIFLKHDVAIVVCTFTLYGEWLTGAAKWQDILQLYEVDKRPVYRLLPKVTETHMQHCAQSAVTISLSAQAVSSIVTAAINTPVTAGKDKCAVSLNDMLACQKWCYVVQLFVTIVKTVPRWGKCISSCGFLLKTNDTSVK
jgi:hypothetical protein